MTSPAIVDIKDVHTNAAIKRADQVTTDDLVHDTFGGHYRILSVRALKYHTRILREDGGLVWWEHDQTVTVC